MRLTIGQLMKMLSKYDAKTEVIFSFGTAGDIRQMLRDFNDDDTHIVDRLSERLTDKALLDTFYYGRCQNNRYAGYMSREGLTCVKSLDDLFNALQEMFPDVK